MGKITKATLGINILFGFGEDEIIGRRINVLMPPPYYKNHESILQAYLNGKGSGNVIGKERLVMGMHKS